MTGTPDRTGAPERPLEPVLAEVATGLWRLRRRLGNGAEPGPGALAGAARQVQRILDTLSEAGIRVDDHLGVAFHPGLAMDVVSYQPTAGLDREVVIDVERPSVYRGADTLQRARVIVGVPGPPPAHPEEPEPAR